MTAPRILVWFWTGGGGGSQFAAQLAHRLALRFGADNVALSMREDDPTVATARDFGVRVRTAAITSSRHKPLASAAGLLKASGVLADHARDTDVVIAAMNFAIAAPLAAGLSKPLVYCAHDPVPHPGDYESGMQRLTQGALLHRADAVVGHSTFAVDALRRAGVPEHKLHMAPLASVFPPAQTLEVRVAKPVRLLFLGRMINYKGTDILANALPLVGGRNDWCLTIAGHGPALTPELVSRLSQPQVESIKAGWLSEAEIADLFARHDVLLAPYRSASQSGVIAQAMAAGLPCVVTPVGGLVEQIGAGGGGWISEAATPVAFAAALTDALDDDTNRKTKAEGAIALARAAWDAPHWDWLERDWRRTKFGG
ncbi:MAG: glycosyltransferase family 4 protein [Hyphomonadaceae bacterium]|nr:glycosyltransferase family 4 protein [Hyphomonadaceae bacterium]